MIQENLFTSAEFIAVIALTNLMAWVMLLCAGRSLDRSWREVEAGAPRRPGGECGSKANVTLAARWGQRTRTLLNHNPVLWIAQRRVLKFSSLWVATAALWVVAILVGLAVKTDFHLAVLACMLIFMHLMLSFEVSAAAARSLAEARSSGLLETLLTTPVPEDEIIAGHLQALKRRVWPALALQLALGFSWLGLAALQLDAAQWFLCVVAYIGLVTVHVLEMWVSARLALWKGLQSGSAARGFRRALGSGGLAALGGLLFGVFVASCVAPIVADDVAILAGAIGTLIALTAGAAGLLASTSTRLSENLREVAAIPTRIK